MGNHGLDAVGSDSESRPFSRHVFQVTLNYLSLKAPNKADYY